MALNKNAILDAAIKAVSDVTEPVGPPPSHITVLFDASGYENIVRATIRLSKAEAIRNIEKLRDK